VSVSSGQTPQRGDGLTLLHSTASIEFEGTCVLQGSGDRVAPDLRPCLIQPRPAVDYMSPWLRISFGELGSNIVGDGV
jgi:hypothetical protein